MCKSKFIYIQTHKHIHSYTHKYNHIMESAKTKERTVKITSFTWQKDSHSLYDYESTKIVETIFEFPLTCKGVTFYRKKNTANITAIDSSKKFEYDPEEYEFLSHGELEMSKSNNKYRVNILNSASYKDKNKKITNQKQKTNESIESINQKQEEPYVIVSKLKVGNEIPTGCKLSTNISIFIVPGMTLKLGRIQYYISQYSDGQNRVIRPKDKTKAFFNDLVIKYQPNTNTSQEKTACKICLEDAETQDNFLFNPCKCNGSCGTVHLQCLLEWIRMKVKKEVIGGTVHYNFQKFECEVCKSQFPAIVEVNNIQKQLISLDRPKDNYIILEGACQKQKSIMIIQNTPSDGIKLGRGHDCEIRLTDISVSRKHAIIKSMNQQFFIFDNKSKFGTLVREDVMNLDLKKEKKSIQIGRTLLQFELTK